MFPIQSAICVRAVLVLVVFVSLSQAAQMPQHIFTYDMEIEWPGKFENEAEDMILKFESDLKGYGFQPFINYWGDFLANPVGGLHQDASWMQLLVFGGEFDLQKIGLWEGSSIFVSAADAAGSNLSLKIGNVFNVSQAYVMNTFSLYNLYLKQKLFDDKLELHIGRLSASQYFATLPAMGLVVSGAVNGNPTSLFLNAPFYSTGEASWAAHAKWIPNDETYAEAGIFQTSSRIGNPNYHGVDFSIQAGDGILMLAEIGWTPTFGATEAIPAAKDSGKKAVTAPANPGLPGVYSFGAYLSNYEVDTFDGGKANNAYGFYWVAQQMVWRSPVNFNHNFSLWGGVTYSPQEQLAQMPVMGMGGLIWQGLIPTRDQDDTLLSFYIGGFGDGYADAAVEAGGERPTTETVLEASYIIQLTERLQVQPDLQWIIRPSGKESIPNSLVIGFQVAMIF